MPDDKRYGHSPVRHEELFWHRLLQTIRWKKRQLPIKDALHTSSLQESGMSVIAIQFPDGRQTGSYPGTGFDGVEQISNDKSARLETKSWMLARFSVLIRTAS